MFVPAESVFAALHDRFPAVVEEGFRRRVYIVSPTTLMATLNTVRAILKDAQMREQAHVIQTEIGKLMDDMQRLDERVRKLGAHFGQTQEDVARDPHLDAQDRRSRREDRRTSSWTHRRKRRRRY